MKDRLSIRNYSIFTLLITAGVVSYIAVVIGIISSAFLESGGMISTEPNQMIILEILFRPFGERSIVTDILATIKLPGSIVFVVIVLATYSLIQRRLV